MSHRFYYTLSFAAMLLCRPGWAEIKEKDGQWEWFRQAPREVSALLADPREAQLRVGFLFSGNGNNFFDTGLGGQVGIARTETRDDSFSINARGLVASRFQFHSVSFDLFNIDFIGGVATSYRWGRHSLELYLSHQSSHLGDDLVAQGTTPLNVSFENIRLLYSTSSGRELRLYNGLTINVSAEPSRINGKVGLIAGAEWYFLPSVPRVFAALDLRSYEQHNFSLTGVFTTGYELGSPAEGESRQRIFLEIFNGHSKMGQFDTQQEFYVMLGLGYAP